jgi:RNA recognition motif-containing protein
MHIKAPQLSEKNKKYLTAPLTIDENRLYITNIPYHITEEELKTEFNKFGTIQKVKVPLKENG